MTTIPSSDRLAGFEAAGGLLAPLGGLLRGRLAASLRPYGAGGHRLGLKQGAHQGCELVGGNLHGFVHEPIVRLNLFAGRTIRRSRYRGSGES